LKIWIPIKKWRSPFQNVDILIKNEDIPKKNEDPHSKICPWAGLPRDGRTLLSTPRKTDVSKMHPGKYWHNGFAKGLAKILKFSNSVSNDVEVTFSIDGLPISKSPARGIWPILCSAYKKVFVVGVYYGEGKPPDPNVYLKEFVEEAVSVCEKGIDVSNRHFNVSMKKFIADCPAKSFGLGTVGHNHHHGCPKCTVEGITLNKRTTFLKLDAPLRTDTDFMRQTDLDYHLGETPLIHIPEFGCVTNVCLDYLHVVCFGVMKKMIQLWKEGPLTVRVGENCIREINEKLSNLFGYLPREFNRKAESIKNISQLKATEFRLLLLYTGVFAFSCLPTEFYDHYMQLHVGVLILCSRRYSQSDMFLKYADSLLRGFVENFMFVYGQEYISHNVHVLIHLKNDCKNFGCLDDFSAFPFENFMQELKKLLRKPGKVLQQLARRYSEREYQWSTKVEVAAPVGVQPSYNGVLPRQCINPQFLNIVFPDFRLDLTEANNCCGLRGTRDVMVVENFATCAKQKDLVAIGRVFQNVSDLYVKPVPSTLLGCLKVSGLGNYCVWPAKEIDTKYVRFPLGPGVFAVLPLLHHE